MTQRHPARRGRSEPQSQRPWSRRIRSGVVGGTLVSVVSLSLLLPAAAQATDATGDGATLLSASENAIAHEHSVHLVSFQSGTNVSANASPNASVTIVTDAGSSEGIQRVTFAQGGASGHETVEVAGGDRISAGTRSLSRTSMASARLQRHTMQTHGSKCRPPTAPSPVSRPQ